jgi:hypothetical protein
MARNDEGNIMRLSHSGFAALEQAIYELHDYRDLDRFRQEVPAILIKLIPSESWR